MTTPIDQTAPEPKADPTNPASAGADLMDLLQNPVAVWHSMLQDKIVIPKQLVQRTMVESFLTDRMEKLGCTVVLLAKYHGGPDSDRLAAKLHIATIECYQKMLDDIAALSHAGVEKQREAASTPQ